MRRPSRASAPNAPAVSFCRIDDKEIRLREPIIDPDALIAQDPTLFKTIDVFQGLKQNGYLLVNSNHSCAAECPCGAIKMVPERI